MSFFIVIGFVPSSFLVFVSTLLSRFCSNFSAMLIQIFFFCFGTLRWGKCSLVIPCWTAAFFLYLSHRKLSIVFSSFFIPFLYFTHSKDRHSTLFSFFYILFFEFFIVSCVCFCIDIDSGKMNCVMDSFSRVPFSMPRICGRLFLSLVWVFAGNVNPSIFLSFNGQ